jgi:hypothetical protein
MAGIATVIGRTTLKHVRKGNFRKGFMQRFPIGHSSVEKPRSLSRAESSGQNLMTQVAMPTKALLEVAKSRSGLRSRRCQQIELSQRLKQHHTHRHGKIQAAYPTWLMALGLGHGNGEAGIG